MAKTAAKGEAKFTPEKFEPRHLTSDFLHCDEHKIVTPEGELVADVRGKTPDIACQRTTFLALAPEMYAALKLADYRLTYLVVTQRGKVRETTFNILEEVRAAIKKAEAIHG